MEEKGRGQNTSGVARVWRYGWWAQRVWEMEVPQWGQGAEPKRGSGAKPPEARYAYTISSGQMHFRDVFIEDIWCTFRLMHSLLPPPLLLQRNPLNLCKSHDAPWPR